MDRRILAIATLFCLVALALLARAQQPEGVAITFNQTVNGSVNPAASIATAGGTFTSLILNATSQNYRWKAYVGNVTGSFVLADASNYRIYDWALGVIAGEVFVSRNSSINWATVNCTNITVIRTEETGLNITDSKVDSINNTFNTTAHKSFYVGTTLISNSSCRSIATYVNGAAQVRNESALFQEVLLSDANSRLVYATLLENKVLGFNNQQYDFQMIVPDYGTEAITTAVPYFFYVELS